GHTNLFGDDDFKNALYTIDIGQNDLSISFLSFSYAQTIERIPSFISEIKDALWAIYQLGGRNFWVHNTGPSGCLPRELATTNNLNISDFDQYGCIKPFNDGAKVFNAKLNAMCEELRSQMENSTIVYVDVYAIKYDLIANFTYYGFKNPLMAFCGYGGAPYNYGPDFDKTCSGSQYDVCEEGTSYINWDGVHYTEAANAVIASKIISTHYSSPPLEFNFFCNSVATSSS
ncbi:GDSL esterase/lipase lip-4, partial [Phtheirospermum japonicum]